VSLSQRAQSRLGLSEISLLRELHRARKLGFGGPLSKQAAGNRNDC
jgi:hypothetical protein